MDRDYDIFEKLPDGNVLWHAYVHGLKAARANLESLAKESTNEFYAIHTPTKDVAARINVSNAA